MRVGEGGGRKGGREREWGERGGGGKEGGRERERERERLQAVSQMIACHCYSLVSEYYKPRVMSYSTLLSNL